MDHDIIIGHRDPQIVWGHLQCETEQVSKVWCISDFFSVGGWGGVAARISEIVLYKKYGKWFFS